MAQYNKACVAVHLKLCVPYLVSGKDVFGFFGGFLLIVCPEM